jgi:PAS domain S-box-containing protein
VNKNISEAIYRSTHDKGLIFINEAFVKMFGFDSKEELYQHVKLNSLYANPDDRERLGNLLIKKKEVTNVEVQFQKKNGETFTGLISSMVSLDEEGATYFDGAIRDVTAIKSAQEKLKKQNRELKKLNTELDSFVYSASHDLKAPLSSVKGLINLAKDEDDKEKLAYYLDLVDKSINKLDDFIKDIVDLSRNARQEVKSEPIDFKEIVQDTLDNYQYLENYDRIEKKIKIESDVPFYSDKRRLKVIFNNLISNSIRYFNSFIDNPYVEIVIETNAEHATIEISDNGLGIENQYLEKIFDMFFRASNNSKGTGIGLYIVRETIQKIQGEIQVKSKIAKGSKFTVTIPNLKS